MLNDRNVDVQVPAAAVAAARGANVRRLANRKRVLLVLQYYDYRHHSGVAKYAAQAGGGLGDAYTMIPRASRNLGGDRVVSLYRARAPIVKLVQPGPAAVL